MPGELGGIFEFYGDLFSYSVFVLNFNVCYIFLYTL